MYRKVDMDVGDRFFEMKLRKQMCGLGALRVHSGTVTKDKGSFTTISNPLPGCPRNEYLIHQNQPQQLQPPMPKSKPSQSPQIHTPGSKRPPKHWDLSQRTRPPKRGPSAAHRPTVYSLKTKIRDLTRLLRRPDRFPADVQIAQERALAGYRQALKDFEKERRKRRLIGKYHMVRFFGELDSDMFSHSGCLHIYMENKKAKFCWSLSLHITDQPYICELKFSASNMNQNVEKQPAS